MRRMMDKVLRRYGIEAQVERDDIREAVRIFFQPSTSKSWQNMESEATLLGEISRGQYVYMGPVGVKVKEGDTLVLGERTYLFRRVEHYYYGNEAIYQWGLCVEKGVNDTWGTQS